MLKNAMILVQVCTQLQVGEPCRSWNHLLRLLRAFLSHPPVLVLFTWGLPPGCRPSPRRSPSPLFWRSLFLQSGRLSLLLLMQTLPPISSTWFSLVHVKWLYFELKIFSCNIYVLNIYNIYTHTYIHKSYLYNFIYVWSCLLWFCVIYLYF